MSTITPKNKIEFGSLKTQITTEKRISQQSSPRDLMTSSTELVPEFWQLMEMFTTPVSRSFTNSLIQMVTENLTFKKLCITVMESGSHFEVTTCTVSLWDRMEDSTSALATVATMSLLRKEFTSSVLIPEQSFAANLMVQA